MLHRCTKISTVMQHSYLELASRLRQAIEAGRYPVGARMPSVRHTALAQGVSVSTVMRCYRHLETGGLVEARAKSGMYVADWKAARPVRMAALNAGAAPVEYDKLASLHYRMNELYALTAQTLQLPLHLASATPAWYPCEALATLGQRVLRQNPALLGGYPTGTGLPALKDALVVWLGQVGVDLQPSELLITNGSSEALSVALRAVARPGESVIVESPVYFGLLQMIEHLGIKAIEVPCVPGEGMSLGVWAAEVFENGTANFDLSERRWLHYLDPGKGTSTPRNVIIWTCFLLPPRLLEALEYALEHQTGVRAVVAMPSFQNPLGCAMPEKNKRRLLRLAEQHDLALIEDDVFGDLSPAPERPQPVKAWDRQGRVIYCGSCSKSVAPGFRLGWVAGGKYHARIESLKLSSSLVTPLWEQSVLAAFLQSGALPGHLRKLRERLAVQVPQAVQAVAQHFPAGTQVVSSAGGWWLWLALSPSVDTLDLLRQSVAQGLAFTPGTMFTMGHKYRNCLRLNIARPWDEEMAQGLERLGTLARRMA
jgi:DNA-binding transcriptional MocR family regulator